VREVRRVSSRDWRREPTCLVLAAARRITRHRPLRWTAWELIRHHKAAFAAVDETLLEEFAVGLDSWDSVDAFGRTLSGAAWVPGLASDALFLRWTRSPDVWRRRLALVSTVALNRPAEGGRIDAARTLAICEALVDDREDMVVKALSWALRELGRQDPEPVRRFLARYGNRVSARVRREVGNKLATGLKTPRKAANGAG
jgi:3-methyladenine DNA glycosylase AlkD